MRIVSDDDAIRLILQSRDTFVCYLGAGGSSEAGVKTAWEICDEIRAKLVTDKLSDAEKKRRLSELNWDNDSYRYASCIEAYGNQAARVEYFRQLLLEVQPAFCHHAVAMLATERILKKTLVTTNFDKLIESAFTRQGSLECQPIRSAREIDYWVAEDDKAYVLKLHGDYDTYNIANTLEQIVTLDEQIQDRATGLLESAGMVVLGAAGHEKSVHTFFDALVRRAGPPRRILDFGLLWSVYMGPDRPKRFNREAVAQRIERTVGSEIRNLMERMEGQNEQFAFFPVWGSGNFLLRLIEETRSDELLSRARRYLDHEMRLRNVFERAGLGSDAIKLHLANLTKQRKHLDRLPTGGTAPKTLLHGQGRSDDNRHVSIRLTYGDITMRRMLDHVDVRDLRRAVVSPEDTCISAGGGVAYLLLKKAGPHVILNELSKLQPIPQGTTVVTSGGDLPVEYLFHGAALKIESDGRYTVSKPMVQSTVRSALEQADALGVEAIWLPLFGTGVADFSPEKSLAGILDAISSHRPQGKLLITVTIYSDEVMPRTAAIQAMKRRLGTSFALEPL